MKKSHCVALDKSLNPSKPVSLFNNKIRPDDHFCPLECHKDRSQSTLYKARLTGCSFHRQESSGSEMELWLVPGPTAQGVEFNFFADCISLNLK